MMPTSPIDDAGWRAARRHYGRLGATRGTVRGGADDDAGATTGCDCIRVDAASDAEIRNGVRPSVTISFAFGDCASSRKA